MQFRDFFVADYLTSMLKPLVGMFNLSLKLIGNDDDAVSILMLSGNVPTPLIEVMKQMKLINHKSENAATISSS